MIIFSGSAFGPSLKCSITNSKQIHFLLKNEDGEADLECERSGMDPLKRAFFMKSIGSYKLLFEPVVLFHAWIKSKSLRPRVSMSET